MYRFLTHLLKKHCCLKTKQKNLICESSVEKEDHFENRIFSKRQFVDQKLLTKITYRPFFVIFSTAFIVVTKQPKRIRKPRKMLSSVKSMVVAIGVAFEWRRFNLAAILTTLSYAFAVLSSH